MIGNFRGDGDERFNRTIAALCQRPADPGQMSDLMRGVMIEQEQDAFHNYRR